MYLRILKKDLKRKKTMNIILLLFVILATMFAASSANNIITVIGGLDYYFEKANISDHFVITLNNNGDEIEEFLSKQPNVKDFRREDQLFFNDKELTKDGKKLAEFANAALLLSIDNGQLNYFDKNNEILKQVPEGEAYFTGSIVPKIDLEKGDEFMLKLGDTELTLKYAGIAKDAFLGSEMFNNPRIIISNADYEKFTGDEKVIKNNNGTIYYINGYDTKTLESDLSDIPGASFNKGVSLVRTSYVMNAIVAGLLLIVSICLILVSFVVLRFTISFTINEEFREIGVMKALGLKNSSIRSLYLVKYLGIAVIGAFTGLLLSIPFGQALMKSVSDNMVLGNDNMMLINIACSLFVVLIILLFCWRCTHKIKTLSAIDAVRSGQTGERFRKKGLMHLGKSRLGATGFLAFNDVFSSPKQFCVMTVIFTVCLLLVMSLANSANTLSSGKLLPLFGVQESEVYITDTELIAKVMTGEKTYKEMSSDIENRLADNGMPCKVTSEALVYPTLEANGKKASPIFMYNKDTKASDYTYSEGYAPKYSNEIAITPQVAEKLGVSIGDKIKLTFNGKTDEYIISAFFQSMMQLGETGRFHESFEVPDELISQVVGFQVDFDDSPDKETINSRIEKMKDIFNSKYVDDSDGFVMACIGANIKETINRVKLMVLLITSVIIILISILMERSFISKEKPEIALMKAMGFSTRSVIAQHTLRFAIVAAAASVLSILLSTPVTKLCIDPIFGIMGAIDGVDYNIKPLEVYALYPVIIIAVAILGASLTALYMRSIKASDTADI
ncbi:ABC transporter permease [Ruminococcus flavefaciens]|uniref:ABC transporter permease n=1 Tax=Ruminococcus flavefaciens TaxID=1265 RepID=UPI0002DA241D|nr:ABC transporter permease [Ruminococcus flavefaciens]